MFTVKEEVQLLLRLLDSKKARLASDGQTIERIKMDFWAPVWQADPTGNETPWGRGKLTVEGEELLFRYAIAEARKTRQPLKWA